MKTEEVKILSKNEMDTIQKKFYDKIKEHPDHIKIKGFFLDAVLETMNQSNNI